MAAVQNEIETKRYENRIANNKLKYKRNKTEKKILKMFTYNVIERQFCTLKPKLTRTVKYLLLKSSKARCFL